jgi:hypothetical protein
VFISSFYYKDTFFSRYEMLKNIHGKWKISLFSIKRLKVIIQIGIKLKEIESHLKLGKKRDTVNSIECEEVVCRFEI